MESLRRILPSLAAFLAVLIVVQTTDLIVCADEAEAAENPGEVHTDGLAGAGHAVPALNDAHDSGAHDHDEGKTADCLCHIVFAPTTVVPEIGGRPTPEAVPLVMTAETPPGVEPEGPDHVPLG